jgi:hypothetical protein
MPTRYIVYGLTDPDSGELKYIGKSCSRLRRPSQHWLPFYMKREGNTLKKNWLRSVLARGKEPKIHILDECESHEDVCIREIDAISYYRYIGCELLNVLGGGDGFTPEQARMLYLARTPESRERSKQNMLAGAISSNVRARNNLKLRKPIKATHVETKEERWYLSASHAAADGIGSRPSISNCLRPTWRCKSNKGWKFEYVK